MNANPSTIVTTALEPLLYSHINNEAMRGYAGASTLFYLPGRKISFRCCVHQNFKSDNPPYLSRIEASYRDAFEPEKIMGGILGEASYNPELGGRAVPITEAQIPAGLAEKIQKVANDDLAYQEKHKAVAQVSDEERQKAFLAMMTMMPMEAFEAVGDEEKTDECNAKFNEKEWEKSLEGKIPQALLDEMKDDTKEKIKEYKYQVGADFNSFAQTINLNLLY